jgi:hypothetical protein
VSETKYMAANPDIQLTPVSDADHVHKFEAALSPERFARYVNWAGGDRTRALELYSLNTKLSESLYTPLQALELALRNRIHAVMSEAFSERWFESEEIVSIANQRKQIAQAKVELERDKTGSSTIPGKFVAAVSFSFWTAMLSPDYETLWRSHLNAIASKAEGKGYARKYFSRPLGRIRTLRNRIAHHEPILGWKLREHFEEIMDLTAALSPSVAEWCLDTQSFVAVFPADAYVLIGA